MALLANGGGSAWSIFTTMQEIMNQRYRLWQRRGKVFYSFDRQTGKQTSLGTKSKATAQRLIHAKNEADSNPLLNRQIARAYLAASDPAMLKRTWRKTLEDLVKTKEGENAVRWAKVINDKALSTILDLPLIDTRPEHLLDAMQAGKVSTNVYLRRIHNFALDMDYLLKAVIPKRQWPKVEYGERRAITPEEHARIIEREGNPERKALYELCWHLGGSQGDIAHLCAEDVDWNDRVVSYSRKKTGQPVLIRLDSAVAEILKRLPSTGPLFPNLRLVEAKDRANEFRQRCHGLKIFGVSLHSYRYSWAERARQCGYPERFAQEALGHGSKAVHRAYAKKAKVLIPAMSEWQNKPGAQNLVKVNFGEETKKPVPDPAGNGTGSEQSGAGGRL